MVLITTSNCAEEAYAAVGYESLMDSYKNTFNTFVGSTEVFVCGDTLQVKDYSKYGFDRMR